METSEQVKQIKRSFRLFMNGVTAASMRSKGLNYKINWGVQLPDLKRMAAQYGHNAELASALWAESGVRECRLLATLIMPADKMSSCRYNIRDNGDGCVQSVPASSVWR